MTLKKILSLGALFAVFFSATAAPKTFADNDPSGCNLSQDKFDAIKNIQSDASLSYLQEIRSELAARKELLTETVDCAITEAQNMKAGVDAVNSNDSDTKKLQSQYSGQLNDALGYYGLQKDKINDLGLQGSKNFASDLAVWRAGNYEPLAKRSSNFILWSQNQALIQTAKNRLDQLSRTTSLLNMVGDSAVHDLWQKANDNWNDTSNWNKKAEESLQTFGPPDESLNDIKSSLTALSAAYQNFFDILGAMGKTQ